ncbi:MAG TPA: hypothetical protein VD994_11080 [Prosthecobacter sp.]|nr:hypothetical protein [Prosthecobacter sp.]
MPVEAVTGINVPSPPPAANISSMFPTLEEIATCCVKHLRAGGYISEAEGKEVLTSYLCSLTSRNPPKDFLLYTAEVQGAKHSLGIESEVSRMQRLMRGSLHERVHYWTFGPLPGRAASLYDHCPSVREACAVLGCPAVVAGETSIVHVASINPVAALVASALIVHEVSKGDDADAPFVFPFLIDLPGWNSLLHRHFAI